LLKGGRNAYRLNTCLSPVRTPSPMSFGLGDYHTGLVALMQANLKNERGARRETTLVCYPLQTILEAIGVTHVDLFSLYVEGAELSVLKTLDWNRITIDVIMLEYAIYPWGSTPEASLKMLEAYKQYLVTDVGLYELVTTLPKAKDAANGLDVIFKRKSSMWKPAQR